VSSDDCRFILVEKLMESMAGGSQCEEISPMKLAEDEDLNFVWK
jgi:hypothetical protein